MPVHLASLNDLDELTPLFAAYLAFYEVPRSLSEVRAFLAQRLDQSDSVLLMARDAAGEAQGFIQLYPIFNSLELQPAYADLARRNAAASNGGGAFGTYRRYRCAARFDPHH